VKTNKRIEDKFEEWFWDCEDGFQFKAERCFQWAQIAAEKPDTLNRFLTDWIKGAYEAAYKEGYRDALASLHYTPEDKSGSSAVLHLQ
jgi:hypothetical protein